MWANLAAAFALLALPAAASAADFSLIGLTGAVELSDDREIRAVARSARLPIPVRPGSAVRVLAGDAAFEGREVALRARAGDSFLYNEVLRDGVPAGLRLKGLGPRTGLVLDVRESTLVLYEGDAVSVVESANGALEVQSRGGFVTLSMPGEDRVLPPGQVAVLSPAPGPLPEPRPALLPPVYEDLRIVEPGEELRSAVGPTPRRKPSGGCRHP